MVSARLYVEGGGDSKELKTACRRGFASFLDRAGVAGRMPRIVACGSRANAFDRFKTGHESKGVDATLLVDAEGPVTAKTAWGHLQQSDGWSRPKGATDDQCHLMVQVMESWFLADKDALEAYFGQGFRRQALPANPNVEQIPKQDVISGLERASDGTGKGRYNKGAHSFEILASLDPTKVRKGSCYAERFVKALL